MCTCASGTKSTVTSAFNTSADGVFFNVVPTLKSTGKCLNGEISDGTLDTIVTTGTESFNVYLDDETSPNGTPRYWKPSGTISFLRNVPLLVNDPEHDDEPMIDAAKRLGEILTRSKKHSPSNSAQYASNHIMINQERVKRCVAPLYRLSELDEIAREHAHDMANKNSLFHVDPKGLKHKFLRPARRMGENIAKGKTISEIHVAMMETSASDRSNIIDRRYTHMGMGTAKCTIDGSLYLCQVFRG